MRIDRETKEAVAFYFGLLGLLSQGVLTATGNGPSIPLLGTYLALCGLPWMYQLDEKRRNIRRDSRSDGG